MDAVLADHDVAEDGHALVGRGDHVGPDFSGHRGGRRPPGARQPFREFQDLPSKLSKDRSKSFAKHFEKIYLQSAQ